MALLCGYKWWAPKLMPNDEPGKPSARVLQKCVLEKGHEEDHRSEAGVTALLHKKGYS